MIAFKQKKEQEELEAKGRYEEATEKLATQYREAEQRQKEKVLRLDTQKILQKAKCQQLFGQTRQSGANIVNNCKFFIYGRRSNQA